MGFSSVYRALSEIFPQIDTRILRAVAIEHHKDADEAAAVVLSEIVPSLSSNSSHNLTQSLNKSSGSISERKVERDLEDVVSRCRGLIVASGSKSSASSSSSSSSETIPLVATRGNNTSNPSTELVSVGNELRNLPPHAGRDVFHIDVESEEVQSVEKAPGKEHGNYDFFGKCFDVPREAQIGVLVPEDDEASVVSAVAQGNFKLHGVSPSLQENFNSTLFSFVPQEKFKLTGVPAVAQGNFKLHVVSPAPQENFKSTLVSAVRQENCKSTLDPAVAPLDPAVTPMDPAVAPLDNFKSTLVSAIPQEDLYSTSDYWQDPDFFMAQNQAESSTSRGSELVVQRLLGLTTEDNMINVHQGSCSEVGSGSTNVVDETLKGLLASENGETELGGASSTSTHRCNTDHLEEIIEEAKSNKKTLLTVMEFVMNLMREVEVEEKSAEKSKEEAAKGGLDTLEKVENLKKMLAHAKETNDMHAGEVYGERSILATEVKELENRLLNLSEERNKSLAVLDAMRDTLETRLDAAFEMKKAALQDKKEREDSALKVLAEQEAIMEKVVQESEFLQQEAEENSKLREFLMDRGKIVDSLQGEISVICQDVKLLKEKFDNRESLTKSISSSQSLTKSVSSVSSSQSSNKSVSSSHAILVEEFARRLMLERTSDQFKGVPETSINNKFPEEAAAASSMNQKKNDNHRELLEDGWDIFDKETEL